MVMFFTLTMRPDPDEWSECVNIVCLAADCVSTMTAAIDADGKRLFANDVIDKVDAMILDG
jgi:hypothetical protein